MPRSDAYNIIVINIPERKIPLSFIRKADHRQTVSASLLGYVTQACCLNFLPLLFVTLHSAYGITLTRITGLVTVSFGVQLAVDWICSLLAGRLNIRVVTVGALFLCSSGLAGLSFMPGVFPDPYTGLLACVLLYSVGGGLLEVMINPIVENCPTKNKPAMMSLLHSFYCWGSLATVGLSTLFFALFGLENYPILALMWAVVPLVDAVWFMFVPLYGDCEAEKSDRGLLKEPKMWFFLLIMFCAGAAEQAMSQWASAFAENAMGVSKAVGDLAGPCAFALLMGTARTLYSALSAKMDLKKTIAVCAAPCTGCYLLAALSPYPIFGLLGCALCGFSVGVMWPGTCSLAAGSIKGGGTAMFALLALAGDLGCGAGPSIVGFVSAACGDSLSAGLLAGAAVPALLCIALVLSKNKVSITTSQP